MAIMKMTSVYDSKAESFMAPSTVVAIGVASRDFTDAFTSPDSKMASHKDDFLLYHIGDFDTSTGFIEAVVPPRLVLKGADLITE